MKGRFFGFSLILGLFQPALAQQKNQDSPEIRQLDEVVVTDSRFALKRENSGKTVIKITADELERNQGKSVAEVLNTQAGLEFIGSRSASGQNISLFGRGGNNRQVLVLIDGIQVFDPSNPSAEFDLRLLNLSQIETIEVVKGAASTLYGNAAATAVINITTRKAETNGFTFNLQSILGTNQSQDDQDFSVVDFSNTGTIFYKEDAFSASASFGNQNTNGLSAVVGGASDQFNRNNGNIKAAYQFSEAFKADLSFYYDEIRFGFDNGFPLEEANFEGDSEQFRYGVAAEYKYGLGSVNFKAALNEVRRSFESNFPSEFDSQSFVFDLYNKLIFSKRFHTIVGVNLIDQQTEFTEQVSSTSIDPYANVVYVSDFGLNVNAGLRLNNHSEYGSNLVYNINPSYIFKGEDQKYIKFFASIATSFIAPNLSQLFGAFGPNPNLDPEENRTIEGGFEFGHSKYFGVSALYFDRLEENRIDFVVTDFNTFAGEFQNLNTETDAFGIELGVTVSPIPSLKIQGNYTFTNTSEGLGLRIPRDKANTSVRYDLTKKWSATASYQYVSSRADTDFNTFQNVELDAFNLVGLYTRYQFKKFSVFLNLDNLFNENYFEIFDNTTRGRNVRLGITANF